MKSKTIVWYTVKYAALFLITQYAWSTAGKLVSAKNDVENIFGFALFTGLFLTLVLVFKNDLVKLTETLVKSNKQK